MRTFPITMTSKKGKILDKSTEKQLLDILLYFEDGLANVEAGCGEKQPYHQKIKNAIIKIKNLPSV